MPLTPRRSSSANGGVVGQQLRVDVQLAHAACDELRELAAEVEHDDAVGRLRRAVDRWAGRRAVAFGRRRVEGDLEVRLDLGVVGREDAVAGVGRLAMDGLAARAGPAPVGRLGGWGPYLVERLCQCASSPAVAGRESIGRPARAGTCRTVPWSAPRETGQRCRETKRLRGDPRQRARLDDDDDALARRPRCWVPCAGAAPPARRSWACLSVAPSSELHRETSLVLMSLALRMRSLT